MSNFLLAVTKVLEQEGGYVNDPDDPGGETNWGISKRSYPDLDIANLSRDEAIAIYRRDFWNHPELNCEGIRDPYLAVDVMDFAVTSGPHRSARTLQRAFNLVRHNNQEWLAVDGWIGPKTLRAVNGMLDDGTGPALYAAFIVLRGGFYVELVHEERNRKFIRGWLNRLEIG